MHRWEAVLQEQYERDRARLLDYQEVELEFKAWLIRILYEEVKKDEHSEHDSDDGPLYDDRICDRERIRPEQDQIPDPGIDLTDGCGVQDGAAEERLAKLIAAEPEEEYIIDEEEDIYESYYEEIAQYKSSLKAGPKKKKHKRK